MPQVLLYVLTILLIVAVTSFIWYKASRERYIYKQKEIMTKEKLLTIIKREIADEIEKTTPASLSDDELEQSIRRRAKVKSALRQCVDGLPAAKELVKELISTIIRRRLPEEKDILKVIDFKSGHLLPEEKWETIIHFYKKTYGEDAVYHFIKKYKFDRERYIQEDKTQPGYVVTVEDLNEAYALENFDIKYADMVSILATLMYEKYKGYGILDTLNDANINGFNIGTSGRIMTHIKSDNPEYDKFKAPNSVWLFFEGKFIHLRFLNFYTQEEVMRVIKLMIRYNRPGPLTEKRGYIVNTMANKSRVSAAIPPMAEFPAAFIRKFTLSNNNLYTWVLRPHPKVADMSQEEWVHGLDKLLERGKLKEDVYGKLIKTPPSELTDEKIKTLMKGVQLPGYVKGGDVVINMIKYLMKGQRTTLVTGRQGSGKTTLMVTLAEFIDIRLTIRVIEMAFELYLREHYPERNILSLQETPTVTAMEAQDFTKKSDGAVTIVGEIAQDAVAERWLQATRIASIFTLATHHANTTADLVTGLRDHIVASGNITSLEVAERQVLEGLKFDIHLDFTEDGYRYIERITEVIPHVEKLPIPDINPKNIELSSALAQRNYYSNKLNEDRFKVRDIIVFDKDKMEYKLVNIPSDDNLREMLKRMNTRDRVDFANFLKSNKKGA